MIHGRALDAVAFAGMVGILAGAGSMKAAEYGVVAGGLAVGFGLLASILVGLWVLPSAEAIRVQAEMKELLEEESP